MADNLIYIPFANPVKFFDPDRATLDAYFTKHFDEFPFAERLYAWQSPEDYKQIWQTSDIIYLQFESTFDPIIVELLDQYGTAQITLPALIGLPNKYYPNTFAFEVAMSLASVTTGCYRLQVTAGTGEGQKVYLSNWQYISEEKIENSLLLKYKHSRFHEDIMFESGIEFQYRLMGHIGFMTPGRQDEAYKDQKLNPAILSSKTFRQFLLVFGDEFGLPDDVIDLLNRIWSCDTVTVDGKSFGITDGGRFELIEVDEGRYPKRGVRLTVEEGNNRNSSIFAQTTDTTKKLQYGIVVEAKVFGDLSNQGSSNTVPLITVE
jgi:hypothetical protein